MTNPIDTAIEALEQNLWCYNMDEVPYHEDVLFLFDEPYDGQYILSGWRSARALRTKDHTDAAPIAWRHVDFPPLTPPKQSEES